MKSIIKTFVFALLLINAGICPAAEAITGAFGFKLDEVPDAGSVLEREKDDSGIYTYYVKSASPDPSFQRYEVMVIPESRKVFCINAWGVYNTKEAALKEMKSILEKLESKYGRSYPMRDSAVIESGDRYVMISVAERPDKKGSLMATYCDDKLKKLAEAQAKEAKETKVATEGKSGQIEGAFGFKFGDVVDPSGALEMRTTSKGPQYVVKAPKPNSAFNEYFLFITPKTHRIGSIWARGEFVNLAEAKKKQAEPMVILEGKYGKIDQNASSENNKVIVMDDGFVSIRVAEMDTKEGAMLITYHNLELMKLRDREQQEEAVKKTDKSGL